MPEHCGRPVPPQGVTYGGTKFEWDADVVNVVSQIDAKRGRLRPPPWTDRYERLLKRQTMFVKDGPFNEIMMNGQTCGSWESLVFINGTADGFFHARKCEQQGAEHVQAAG
jgi:hypothetical protein